MSQTAFLFPGQGAQQVGMAGALLDRSSEARAIFARASEILGYDLAEVCLNGPLDRLNATEVSQPAIFVHSWAALADLRLQRPELVERCGAAAGLSLGEYTALAFAGVMPFEDCLKVVQVRGQAMQAAADQAPSGMCSLLGLERAQVEQICDQASKHGGIWVANLLGPGNIVVSGEPAALQEAARLAESAQAMKVVPLAVAGAFHTEMMRSARGLLADVLSATPLEPPRLAVVSNVTARPHAGPPEIRQLLVQQVTSPVLWEASMNHLTGGGFDHFWEIGPGRVLRGLLRRIDRRLQCDNYGDS